VLRSCLLITLLAAPVLAGNVRVEGPETQAEYLRRHLPVLVGEVERALGFEYGGELTARLARNAAEFHRIVGPKPEWVAAVGIPRDATLVVRLSAVGPERGLALDAVLRHELVHVLLPPRLAWRARLPLWFEEGLAQLVGGRINRSDLARLPIAAAAGTLIPLDELRNSFPTDRSRAALAYAEGESVVELFLSRHGMAGLHRLLDDMTQTGSFEASLQGSFGTSAERLEDEWKVWLAEEEEPWWLAILRGAFVPFLFFVVSLLAIVAFVRLRRRRREEYAELPE
jgi:hypothetical protein